MTTFPRLLLGLPLFFGSLSAAENLSPYEGEIAAWRKERVEHLTAPDGWLSLVALLWLNEGAQSIGSAPDCVQRLPGGPSKLGTVTADLAAGRVRIDFAPGAEALVDGSRKESAELVNDTQEKPTTVAVSTLSFRVLKRGARLGLRVKDSASLSLTHFQGLDYYPVDPSWRIVARWVPAEPGKKIKITNVIGQVNEEPVPGKAVFEREGKSYELTPIQDKPGEELFFVIRDLTSGKETYGASRFLYAAEPSEGKVILDFNKAFNPPCAFSPFATCPLPPPENVLKLAIRAGEKKYRGHE
jgi:uncharacterized protein (DUF1684 family)